MARRSLIEQLDEAVQAIIIHPSTPLPGVDVRIAPLISVAAELRDLPRPDFKARLKADLEREISSMRNSMLSNSTRSQGTTTAVNPIREGFHTITPYLIVDEAAGLIDFVKDAFGAEESGVYRSPDGTIVHAKVRIGSSLIEMGEAHGEYQPMPTTIYMYVENADAVYKAALAAGGTSLSEPADQPYGDRNGGVRDPFGNEWYIATHISDVGM